MPADPSHHFTCGVIAPVNTGGRPAVWAATGRIGGVSRAPFDELNLAAHVGDAVEDVVRNRELVREFVGADGLTVMKAEHGSGVVIAAEPGDAPVADGLISQTPGLAIAALAADCATVALCCDDDLTVAVIHCGWKGLGADVVGVTMGRIAALGARVSAAVLGPAICGACYDVPLERVEEVRDLCSAGVSAAATLQHPDGAAGIDVRSGVIARLAELDVRPSMLTVVGGCTREDPSTYSYRRDGVTGRHGLVVVRARGTVAS